jgi:predicted MPP superfamily phosphohydrolase
LISISVAALVGLVIFLDAFAIEPYRIDITHHHIRANTGSPIKIAHLTDLHTYGVGRREQKVLDILESERPDLIVITGDLVDTQAGYAGSSEVLKRMSAPLGVWVVRGNHEVLVADSERAVVLRVRGCEPVG